MEGGSSNSNCVQEKQRFWANKLEHIDLEDLVQVSKFAGGGCSHVSLVQLRGYPESAFALKSIQKNKMQNPELRKTLLNEKRILSEIQSDFVVKLYRTFKTNKHLYMLMEYLPGGELFSVDKPSENAAKFYVACVVEALDCLHKKNIAHNDLKASNVVLDVEGYAKLIDFGCSVQIPLGEKSRFNFGTPCYLPPEIYKERDKAVDLWALGVLLYEVRTGRHPFCDDHDDEEDEDENDNYVDDILQNIQQGIDFVNFPRTSFSEEAEDLVRRLCAYDPESRLGYGCMDEIRNHRWFDDFDWSKLQSRELVPPIVPKVDSALDITNFHDEVSDSDSDIESDESDWDEDY